MPYVFRGITQFANDAAKDAGLSDDQRGQVASGWHVKHIAGMLSSLPGIVDQIEARRIGPEAAKDVLDRIASARAGIAAQLAAVDAAVADVVAGLGLAPEDSSHNGSDSSHNEPNSSHNDAAPVAPTDEKPKMAARKPRKPRKPKAPDVETTADEAATDEVADEVTDETPADDEAAPLDDETADDATDEESADQTEDAER